ncbi:MAG: hypothetical protein KatS3mg065_0554 [Chloroflexota bacterium]|nr:MAG: hypothetical protein KatS3mg065_0554 [Chloroflexota bacterium]
MTLVEFLAPLSKAPNKAKVLATLYYFARYEGSDGMTSAEVLAALKRARAPGAARMNVPDVLSKLGAHVDTTGSRNGMKVWRLTTTGEQEARRLVGLPDAEPEVEVDVATLTKLVATIQDRPAREFVEESIKCLQVGALRAAVVFLWAGAIRTLHRRAWAMGAAQVNNALRTHDASCRPLRRDDDFSNVKDSIALTVFQDLGMIDKAQNGTLGEALDLRNRCAHPTKYRPGQKKVSSFIEDVVGIVFLSPQTPDGRPDSDQPSSPRGGPDRPGR